MYTAVNLILSAVIATKIAKLISKRKKKMKLYPLEAILTESDTDRGDTLSDSIANLEAELILIKAVGHFGKAVITAGQREEINKTTHAIRYAFNNMITEEERKTLREHFTDKEIVTIGITVSRIASDIISSAWQATKQIMKIGGMEEMVESMKHTGASSKSRTGFLN